MSINNMVIPKFEDLMTSAKERVDELREKRMIVSKFMSGKNRYQICEACGQSYGNEHISQDNYETVNECLICRGGI